MTSKKLPLDPENPRSSTNADVCDGKRLSSIGLPTSSKLESQLLVQKCLQEIVYLYKISTLIELGVFSIMLLTFFGYDYYTSNVHDFWLMNQAVKGTFSLAHKADEVLKKEHSAMLIELFNEIIKSLDFREMTESV